MENETSLIVKYEGVIWMGVHVALTWVTYTQWIIILFADFVRIGVRKLKARKLQNSSIVEDAKRLSKIPKHLVIVLDEDAILEDLANIILWTFLIGTSYITIHLQKDLTPTSLNELIKICEEKKLQLGEKQLQLNFHTSSNFVSGNLSGCHVMLSSQGDGRKHLVDVTKSLCDQVKQGTLRCEDINLKSMNEYMKDSVPDPEVAFTFSSYPCLHGFHPWKTRLTEIISLSTTKGIQYSTFYDALHKFTTIKQRLGK